MQAQTPWATLRQFPCGCCLGLPRCPTTLELHSFSILFNHRSFQKPDPFCLGFRRLSRKIRIPGKNGIRKTQIGPDCCLFPHVLTAPLDSASESLYGLVCTLWARVKMRGFLKVVVPMQYLVDFAVSTNQRSTILRNTRICLVWP